MSEIVEKFKYLTDKAKYFQKLKDDKNFLFEEIVKISDENIKEVQKSYTNEEKIKKIRHEVSVLLIRNEFNETNFETLKTKINAQYHTNILQSWKDFSILYVFFFNPIKKIVNQYLKDIGEYFLKKTKLNLKLKTTNFDGAQNFGEVGCWIALYNPKYKSQSEGIQYFINFYNDNTTYGTYKHKEKRDIDRKTYDIDNLNDMIIEAIVEDIIQQANVILEDEREKNNMPEYNVKQPLNQILYGPPGTGKTYNTINKALEIIFDKEDKEQVFEIETKDKKYDITYSRAVKDDNRQALKAIFELYKKQIEFVTFHQSYGYEEFIEGIKAKTNESTKQVEYTVEPGIFKKLCKHAEKKERSNINFDKINIDNYINVNQKFNTTSGVEFKIIKISDTIKIQNSQGSETTISKENILKYIELGTFGSQDTGPNYSYQPAIAKYIFDKLNKKQAVDTSNKNYILIIDEINRGNISKIFGELITLIEPSKRIGADEEIKLTLPNSNDPFGVPSNLYIIGTMNTADRSIAQIDTALRRRFVFEEMMPKPDLLVNKKKAKIIILDDEDKDTTIDIIQILTAINERIEYIYDREHTIGHSYFMPLIDTPTKDKLDEIFKINIIPLLAEYFYGDWGDIVEILNDDKGYFIEEKKLTYKTKTDKQNKVYAIKNKFLDNGYINIYDGLTEMTSTEDSDQ
ncbi:MAG: AAA family ATPase, partial [Campylobacterota bacterium]|nr:AAA family ATPase [Campylobacterota bacterium]